MPCSGGGAAKNIVKHFIDNYQQQCNEAKHQKVKIK